MYKKYFLALLILIPAQAFGQYGSDLFAKPRYFSVDVQYVTYSDLVNNSSQPVASFDDAINVNLNTRFYRIFSFITSYGQTSNQELSYIGAGFRVDLPGFLFFSGVANDFVRKRKNRRANTYLQIQKLSVKKEGLDERLIDDKMTFGVDVFVVRDVYLNLEASLYSHQGNQFFAPAVGLGYEF